MSLYKIKFIDSGSVELESEEPESVYSKLVEPESESVESKSQ